MEIKNLKSKQNQLLEHLKNCNYSKDYRDRVMRKIVEIINGYEAGTWASYSEFRSAFIKKSGKIELSPKNHAIVEMIENFDVYGHLPNGSNYKKSMERGKYHLLSNEFKHIIDCYCNIASKRGLKESTIYGNSRNTASFFHEIQLKNGHTLSQITENDIISFFIDKTGVLKRGYSFKRNISCVLKECIDYNPSEITRILSYIPEIRNKRKNIQYLTQDESKKIANCLNSDTNFLTKRDKAIGILAFYTGLRSCDIAKLKLNEIDWENDKIAINQAKTGNLLELPLSAIVGNAIYDYLTTERPSYDNEYVFITNTAPLRCVSSDNLRNIASKIMFVANIRQNATDRQGFHIFRHHIATELLNNDVPRPVISKILGHCSPESIEPYLSADFKHLKACALDITKFNICLKEYSDE